MPYTLIKIKTYKCQTCGWKGDYEPTKENHQKFFHSNELNLEEIEDGACPACFSGHHLHKQRAMKILGAPDICHTYVRHHGKVEQITNLDELHTITIMPIEHVDQLIWHKGNEKLPQDADEEDENENKNLLEEAREKEYKRSVREGRLPSFAKVEADFSPVKHERKELTSEERQALKDKITSDIKKFKDLEHN